MQAIQGSMNKYFCNHKCSLLTTEQTILKIIPEHDQCSYEIRYCIERCKCIGYEVKSWVYGRCRKGLGH